MWSLTTQSKIIIIKSFNVCFDCVSWEQRELWMLTAWDKKFNGVVSAHQPRVIHYPYMPADYFEKIIVADGNVKLLSTGNLEGFTNEALAGPYLCDGEVVSVPWGGYANIKYTCGKFVTTDNRIATSIDTSILSNQYLYYELLSKKNLIDSYYRGASIKHPSMDDVLNTIINVPIIMEQKKIASALNCLDNLITLHQRKYEKLQTIKKGLLEKMFPQNGEDKPQIRFKGFTEAWEQCKFVDIFKFERPDDYMVLDDHYEEDGVPVLTANKAFILGYKNEDNVYDKGDCIIFDDFTLDSKYVDFNFKVNSSAIKILTNKETSNLKFDFYLLQHKDILQQGHARHYISVVQPTITNMPKLNECNKIEKLISNIDRLITLHQCKYEKLQNIKKALLERMFC